MAMNEYKGDDACSLARVVSIVGQRWSFFILREALLGTTRFTDFKQRLGVASDVLTARLETLVGAGLMRTHEYRESNQRTRSDYRLTEAGREMVLAISALQQWGEKWTPSPTPTSVEFWDRDGQDLQVAFVDHDGETVPTQDVRTVRVREP